MVHANHRPVFTYSAAPGKADVFPVSTEYSIDGSACVLHTPKGDLEFHSTLFGKHNIYNIMAAVSAGICLEIPPNRTPDPALRKAGVYPSVPPEP